MAKVRACQTLQVSGQNQNDQVQAEVSKRLQIHFIFEDVYSLDDSQLIQAVILTN